MNTSDFASFARNLVRSVIRTVVSVLVRLMNSPVTPALTLVLFLVFAPFIRRDGETWLYGIELIMGILSLVSVFRCYRRKWVRRVSAALIALLLVSTVSGIYWDTQPSPSRSASASVAKSRQSSKAGDNDPFFEDDLLSPRTCVYCSGSGTCHICHGEGKTECGRCSWCSGTGECGHCHGTGEKH